MPLKLIPPRPGKTPHWSVRGTYVDRFVDRSTKAVRKSVAAQILKKWEAEIESGTFAVKGEATFLSAAVAYGKAGGDRKHGQKLIQHFGEKPLREIDQATIEAAADTLFPEASAATQNREVYTPVSAILKHAGHDFKIRRPKGSRGKVRTDWLWPEQAWRFLDAADTVDAEFGAFLRVLLHTGLRLSEALRIETADVRLAEAFAYVRSTKNGDPRGLSLSSYAVAALAGLPAGLEREGRVFRFRKNGRMYELLNRTRAAAGSDLEWVNFHTFRHTWATWMRRYANLDIKGLVSTGAWRSEQSASRYAHVVVSEGSQEGGLAAGAGEFAEKGVSAA